MSTNKNNKTQAASDVGLLGSNMLKALVLIAGVEVQLGTIVAGAHEASGFTVQEWNELAQEDREILLAEHIKTLEADAQAKAEADAQAKAEADAQAKAEADAQAKAEADKLAEMEKLADEEAAAARASSAGNPTTYVAVYGGPMYHPTSGVVFTNEAVPAELDNWLEAQLEAKKIQAVV